jgi:hypothetical protein
MAVEGAGEIYLDSPEMNKRELRQRVTKSSQVKKHLDLYGEDTSDNLYCGFHTHPDHLAGQKSSTKSRTKKDSTKKDMEKPRQSKFPKNCY